MKFSYKEIAIFEQWLKNRNLNDSSVYMYVGVAKKFLLTDPDIDEIENYNKFIFDYAIKKRSVYYYDALKL